MSDVAEALISEDKRVLLYEKGEKPGPVIIAIAGVHGNESFGIAALRKISEIFSQSGGIAAGEWIGICANTGAMRNGVRFIDEDMNRIWYPSIIDKIRRSEPGDLKTSERQETKELLRNLDPYLQDETKEIIFVDLHSFSAPGGLFLITPRESRNLELLNGLKTPLVHGVDEVLQGTAIRYFHNQGHIAFAFEGGEHHEARTFTNMVAFLLLLSKKAGVINSGFVKEFDLYNEQLGRQSARLPEKVELVYQHIIEPEDRFIMRPGFENFQPVEKGDWLADDKNGKICSPCSGYVLMPLYQEQGEDGFFIVQDC